MTGALVLAQDGVGREACRFCLEGLDLGRGEQGPFGVAAEPVERG
ncbi:hypothetical protein [Streptomyces sp. NPDC001083]